MKALLGFVKTTLVGGFLFLLPVIVTFFLLRKAVDVVSKFVRPIANEIPVEAVAGVHVRQLLSVLALVVIGFVAGLLARTGVGHALSQRLEQLILRKMPGYTLLKGAADGKTDGAEDVHVALARFDDNTVLGFIVEPPSNGMVTIFVPSAPTRRRAPFSIFPRIASRRSTSASPTPRK